LSVGLTPKVNGWRSGVAGLRKVHPDFLAHFVARAAGPMSPLTAPRPRC
jgi:hypothetical protein